MANDTESAETRTRADTLWRIMKVICLGVIVLSVLSCIVIAAVRSRGLTRVSVTALDPDAEPRDHEIAFIKQKDALPDYEVVVFLADGQRISLGTKPNSSAVDGLAWSLSAPVPVSAVTGVRLQDQDKLVTDPIVEVQITSDSVSADNYRFDFESERSLSVGVQSFFGTPIGMAIAAAFFVAVLLIIVSALAG